jgi:hypothetical protein
MRINKKAFAFGLILVFVFLLLIAAVFFQSIRLRQLGDFPESVLGKTATETVKEYYIGEQQRNYIDVAASHAANTALTQLAANGGFTDPACGKKERYNLWTTQENDLDTCFPDTHENAVTLFNQNFNMFMEKASENIRFLNQDQYLTSAIFTTRFTEKRVTATTQQHKHSYTSQGNAIEYAINPSFSIPTSHNINDYTTLKEHAQELTQSCSSVSCATTLAKQWRWTLNQECNFSDFIICITQDNIPQSAITQPLTYQFGLFLDFPEINIVEVMDHEKADDTLIVAFTPSAKDDVESYIIAFSTTDISDPVGDNTITLQNTITDLAQKPNFESCLEAPCMYGTTVTFQPSQLYKDPIDNVLYVVLNHPLLTEEQENIVTVYAVNIDGRISGGSQADTLLHSDAISPASEPSLPTQQFFTTKTQGTTVDNAQQIITDNMGKIYTLSTTPNEATIQSLGGGTSITVPITEPLVDIAIGNTIVAATQSSLFVLDKQGGVLYQQTLNYKDEPPFNLNQFIAVTINNQGMNYALQPAMAMQVEQNTQTYFSHLVQEGARFVDITTGQCDEQQAILIGWTSGSDYGVACFKQSNVQQLITPDAAPDLPAFTQFAYDPLSGGLFLLTPGKKLILYKDNTILFESQDTVDSFTLHNNQLTTLSNNQLYVYT